MSRLKLPLYGKILSWFALNLAVLALLFVFFLKAQFRLGFLGCLRLWRQQHRPALLL